MGKQLVFDFDNDGIKEAEKDNSLYNWCIRNNKHYILDEWNYDKNKDIDTKSIVPSYKEKVWWVCPKGHDYKTSVTSRTLQGTGCPYCANEKPLVGFNDLKTVNPKLAQEFDYEKNTIEIEKLMSNTNKKVWWICDKGHSYQSPVSDRSRGKGCPVCASKIILKGFNDLFTTNPELADSWDYERNTVDPVTISKGSRYRAHWICNKGHRWQAVVYSRACGKRNCPVCSQGIHSSIPEKIIAFYLSKVFADLECNYKHEFLKGFELDIYIPSLNLAIEYDGSKWHQNIQKDITKDNLCLNNGIRLIRIREDRCPKYNSTSVMIDVDKPNNTMNFIEKVIESIENIIYRDYGNKLDIDINVSRDYSTIISDINYAEKEDSLGALCPLALEEWNYEKNGLLSPYSFKRNSNVKVWWKCKKGHEWKALIESRFGKGRNDSCPYCSGKKVIKGFNDIFTIRPDLKEYWDYEKNTNLNPNDIAVNCNKKAWWKCKLGHSFETRIYCRTRANYLCPVCTNHKLLVGYNDLATTYPEIAAEWDYEKNGDLKPTDVMKGAEKKVWWKCKNCGNEWETMIYSRTAKRGQSGCPICQKKRRFKKV